MHYVMPTDPYGISRFNQRAVNIKPRNTDKEQLNLYIYVYSFHAHNHETKIYQL